MRLSPDQRDCIKEEAATLFGNSAEVYLFGSRTDDAQRGGDIDIMIKTPESVERPAVMAARLSSRLSRMLDGCKVDVIIQSHSLDRLPIHEVAERTGVRL